MLGRSGVAWAGEHLDGLLTPAWCDAAQDAREQLAGLARLQGDLGLKVGAVML